MRLRDLARRVVRAGRAPTTVGSQPTPVATEPARTVEVEATSTHLGEVFDGGVLRARRRMLVDGGADYDLVRDHFDPVHYLLQAPELLDLPEVDPVEHYLSGKGRRPSPDPQYAEGAYLARHPARRGAADPYVAWLREGRDAGEIADPAAGIHDLAPALGLSPREVADLVAERRRDLVERLRTGRLGEMIARAAEVEPLIGQTWDESTRPVLLPFSRPAVTRQVAAVHGAQQEADFAPARLVIVVNRPRWGGGRRLEGHVAHALAGALDPAEVVVVYTDGSGETPDGRFPTGTREVDLSARIQGLDPEAAQMALIALLRSLRAEAILNVNSRLLYLALRRHSRALAASERIFLCFFCHEQGATGAWFGWSLRYLYRAFGEVAGVVTDSTQLADELATTYRLPASQRDRLQVLHAPVDASLPVAAAPSPSPGRRPQVFWAGRFGRQKRTDLLLRIARRMPDVDFRVWGDGDPLGDVPTNVTLEGRYAHLRDVPLAEADAWLYTSGWDGVPSQLLEVAMTGVPIVGTLVGGTGEVLHPDESWPVPADGDDAAYDVALRELLADPAAARERAWALRERMLRERTPDAFREHVTALLLPGLVTPA